MKIDRTATVDVDLDALKASVDLLGLVGDGLRRESTAHGGSWAGPCPRCGGSDRFVVRPNGRDGAPPAWWCRQCHPDAGSAIDFVMWRDDCEFADAVRWLADREGMLAHGIVPRDLAETRARIHESERREREHREAARAHLERAYREHELQAALMRHGEVVEALVAGGISEAAIERFGFGYCEWGGHPSLAIPWRKGGQLESVQYRLLDARDGDKYRWATGTSGTLWNGDAVLSPDEDYVVVCEGAKKAAAVWSAGVLGVVAVPNNTSAAAIMADHAAAFGVVGRVFVILDPDSQRQAVEAAAAVPGARVLDLPDKVDDWLVARGCDGEVLARALRTARRVTHD